MSVSVRFLSSVAAGAVLSLLSLAASAMPVRYVATNGSNDNDGLTAATPFATISNAGADYAAKGGVSACDIAGATRIVRGRVDIGAYEYPKVKLTPRIRPLIMIIR